MHENRRSRGLEGTSSHVAEQEGSTLVEVREVRPREDGTSANHSS